MEPYRIKSLTRLVYSQPFELFIAGIILLNAVALALLTMPNIDGEARESLVRFDQIALWIFFFELVARMISYGRKPWMFFKTGWNVFDFIIIGLSPIFAGQTLILRLLRIFRLIRIFRFLPEVRILTKSITRSLPPLMSMSVLIGVVLNAMDEARQENREPEAELEKLQTFAKEVEEISADGEITPEEVTQLKAKI
ncbi:MAG: ion transporter, partial [Candidatus Nanopelagicaceae bacterium]